MLKISYLWIVVQSLDNDRTTRDLHFVCHSASDFRPKAFPYFENTFWDKR